MVGYGAEITHTCDNCRKLTNKIVELCPDCMNEIYEIYDIFGKKRESNNG